MLYTHHCSTAALCISRYLTEFGKFLMLQFPCFATQAVVILRQLIIIIPSNPTSVTGINRVITAFDFTVFIIGFLLVTRLNQLHCHFVDCCHSDHRRCNRRFLDGYQCPCHDCDCRSGCCHRCCFDGCCQVRVQVLHSCCQDHVQRSPSQILSPKTQCQCLFAF